MPEIAEVETVRNTLKLQILHKKIVDFHVYYLPILLNTEEEVRRQIVGSSFIDIKRIGKWLLFETPTHYLLSHLRMEGKFFLKNVTDPLEKHEHVEIVFEDGSVLRYHDTRKFGRMKFLLKSELYDFEGIKKQGIEPIDQRLTKDYLYLKVHSRHIPIKTLLLDQTIISGLGNIYANEVLFAARIHPLKLGSELTKDECDALCKASYHIITDAIAMGGTTIRSYTSSLGVTGRFQQYLQVHKREGLTCYQCNKPIEKIVIGGRSTYFCPFCQKKK